MTDKQQAEERMELSHEAIPIYVTIFHVAITIGVIYLGIIFWISLS